jgi:photosystem II stability/assembly factor-like uncharacterized protein
MVRAQNRRIAAVGPLNRRTGRRRPLNPELIALERRVLLAADPSQYMALPLSFTANVGQANAAVQFVASGSGYGLALQGQGATVSLSQGANQPAETMAMSLIGANPNPTFSGLDPLPGKVNYFLGSDPAQWHTGVTTYAQVQDQNVYPGIDLVYYGNQGQLEYDFRLAPHADPSQIAFKYSGAVSEQLDSAGNLVLGTATGKSVVVHAPVMYQPIAGGSQPLTGAFVLGSGGKLSFTVGRYDPSLPLVIDPILVYSTYFGGSGNDQGLAVAVDSQGAAYLTGSTLSTDLATTAGAVAPTSFIATLFKSTDNGGTWQGSGNGLPDALYSTIAVDPKNPQIVYAASEYDVNQSPNPQGVFQSTDGGRSWKTINTGLTSLSVTSLVIDPVQSSTLYAVAGQFLFKSTDSGAHWSPLAGGLPNDATYLSPTICAANPNVLYTVYAGIQVYRSGDGGATWTAVGPARRLIHSIAVDPTNPNILYYGITKGAFADDPPGGFYKSTDGGNTFNPSIPTFSSGSFSFVKLAIDPANPSILFGLTTVNGGGVLYKSHDSGANWSVVESGVSAVDLAVAGTTPSPRSFSALTVLVPFRAATAAPLSPASTSPSRMSRPCAWTPRTPR